MLRKQATHTRPSFSTGQHFGGLLTSKLCTSTPSQAARARHVTRAWQQVIDQASGKPYYWNTATNETAWELPAAAETTTSVTTIATNINIQPNISNSAATEQQQQQQLSMSNEELFAVLQEAYSADGSGMQFWEVARAHRDQGVFETSFFEYLEQQQKLEGADAEHKELAFKMMCRLSNPLLRQPAPFEV